MQKDIKHFKKELGQFTKREIEEMVVEANKNSRLP